MYCGPCHAAPAHPHTTNRRSRQAGPALRTSPIGVSMQTTNDPRPSLPAGEEQAPDQPAGSRSRTGLSRETLAVRGLQVALGVALLGLWQLAASLKWPD